MKLISWKSLTLFLLLAFMFVFSYRWSEQYGRQSQSGCRMAIALALLAGVLGFVPVVVSYKRNKHILFAAILVGAVFRVAVTTAGVLAIALLARDERIWFLGWSGGFYLMFLVLETSLAVILLHKHEDKNEGPVINDNGLVFSKYESS